MVKKWVVEILIKIMIVQNVFFKKKIASPLWFLYSARRRDLVRIKKKEID
jgi:hypothetical protein